MSSNKNMHSAKREKNDEFYTQISDIEKELNNYRGHFAGARVFCNCDDHRESHFYRFFHMNFQWLGLAGLVSTHYDPESPTYKVVYDGVKEGVTPLKQNGDFRSEECIALLREADIVCTNPPFSLFREYVEQLVSFGKRFLIIGNQNAITYKEVFKLIKENKVWLGIHNNKTLEFMVPKDYADKNTKATVTEDGKYVVKVPAIAWFTNLLHNRRAERLLLTKKYAGNEEKYPKYDNYDAIEVSKVKDIPTDYSGVMGVPITFLEKHNPQQFEIVGLLADKREVSDCLLKGIPTYLDEAHKKYVGAIVKGKATYARIVIRNLNPREF
jgi:hypothetical protein